MTEFISFIDQWQTLIGSLLGGMFALGTALVLASSAVRAARRTAATLLIVDLLSIVSVSENLEALSQEEQINQTEYPLWISRQLNWQRPQLSSSYDAHAANLVGVDMKLSAHLSLLKMVYSDLGIRLARIANDTENGRTSNLQRIPRAPPVTESDAKTIAQQLKLAGTHAACSVHLLEQLVINRTPVFLKRIRMRVCPTPIEITSKELLRAGNI